MENPEWPNMNNSGGAGLSYATTPFTAADLPIDDEGRIYHLQVKPEEIAPDIMLAGDPGRAEFIGSRFLRDLEFEHEHRGLVTVTGTSEITGAQATIISPVKTTITTSGMGTPSLFDPRIDDQHVENMEMESSFLIHFLSGMGHWAGSICPTIANRQLDTFDVHYQDAIENATNVALLALATLRSRFPDVRMCE